MPKYLIWINATISDEIEAKDSDEAFDKFMEQVALSELETDIHDADSEELSE